MHISSFQCSVLQRLELVLGNITFTLIYILVIKVQYMCTYEFCIYCYCVRIHMYNYIGFKSPVVCHALVLCSCVVFFPDYVYFETSSTSPYQIRRIEELNKVRCPMFVDHDSWECSGRLCERNTLIM